MQNANANAPKSYLYTHVHSAQYRRAQMHILVCWLFSIVTTHLVDSEHQHQPISALRFLEGNLRVLLCQHFLAPPPLLFSPRHQKEGQDHLCSPEFTSAIDAALPLFSFSFLSLFFQSGAPAVDDFISPIRTHKFPSRQPFLVFARRCRRLLRTSKAI